MKKIRSNNWCYLMGILPFIVIMLVIAETRISVVWEQVAVAVLVTIIVISLIRKFLYLPYSLDKYGECKEIKLDLPVDWDVKIYSCEEMDRYPFLKRYVEIFSPLIRGKDKEIKVMVSPFFLKKQKSRFVEICVTREIVKYCRKVQIKTTLGVVIPILAWLTFLEAFFLLGWKDMFVKYSGITNFFGPILTAAIIIITLFLWNASISKMDYKLDAELKKYYHKTEIADYIRKWDELLLPDEKELIKQEKREIELHYIKERIDRL